MLHKKASLRTHFSSLNLLARSEFFYNRNLCSGSRNSKNSKTLSSNLGFLVFMCRSSFKGFIALFDNLLLQIRQSGQGASV